MAGQRLCLRGERAGDAAAAFESSDDISDGVGRDSRPSVAHAIIARPMVHVPPCDRDFREQAHDR
jgi:hypothetical protein